MEPLNAPTENQPEGKWAKERVTFIDKNVLEAAKDRIRHLFALYDNVVVSFSGGKDSLVCLELTREVMDEMGMQDVPTRCFFRDEELIPMDVINLVTRYYHDPRFEMLYVCYPTTSQKYVMGQMQTYVQWDPARRHVRPMPDFAIKTLGIPGDPPIDQHDFDTWLAAQFRGTLAVINGIRSYESQTREASTMNAKGPYGYISPRKGCVFCRVIYDWTQRDVFRYFYDKGLRYTQLYEKQMWAGVDLRVATPLHDAAYDTLRNLSRIDPIFYDQLCQVFDHVRSQVAYWQQVDREGIMEKYPKSFAGIQQYIDDTFTDEGMRQYAKSILRRAMEMKQRAIREGRYADCCGNGFPLRQIFIKFIKGQYDRGITPRLEANAADWRYEEESGNGGF